MLLFKKKFLEAIQCGQKTQTIRLWKYRRMKAGQRSYIPGAGYVRIEAVDLVELAELTEEDACRDGFASVELLRREIHQIYPPGSTDEHRPYRVRFTLFPPKEQQRLREEKAKQKARQKKEASDLA